MNPGPLWQGEEYQAQVPVWLSFVLAWLWIGLIYVFHVLVPYLLMVKITHFI
jgi:hypothetical protein